MKLYTVSEIAAILRCGLSNTYRLVNSGALKSVSVGASGKGYRVSEEHLQEFLDARRGRLRNVTPPRRDRTTPQLLKHLDGERLRKAWREQGVE